VGRDLSGPIDPRHVLVIGDALDDVAAAAALGLNCVLYDGGTHPAEQLSAAGVSVVDSLMSALQVGGAVSGH
ncbi:MAG: HAD hydrolase-like protein, partial [Acidimicrobiia bacterium]